MANYPGPILGRITDWYSVYHAWQGERHLDFYRLHQTYGKIVRYGPNSISINSNTALQDIYGFKSNVRKADFYLAFPAAKGAFSTHSAIDKAMHARKRRVLAQAFSDSAMRGLQPHILSVIRTFTHAIADFYGGNRLVEKAKGGWSTPRDMAQWTNYMSYDILGDICYGESFETLERPDNRFAVELVGTSSKFHYLNGQMPGLKQLGLDRILFPELRAKRSRFMAYSRARLQKRAQLGTDTDRRDFFYHLLKAKDPETGLGFSQQELWGESNVLLIAGSDTTSTALSSTFYYLLHSPVHLAKLTSLVRDTFANVEDIVSGPAVADLRFLRACIDESLRLCPPVPTLLPREILEGGMEIDGMYFPATTVVGVPAYSLHHNPEYHPAPFTFNPMRWMVDEKGTNADLVKLAQSAFCPFSIGPRGCIGKGVAYLELTLALARTLWLYDMRLVESNMGTGSDGNYAIKDIFVAEKHGPLVQFKMRDS